MQFRTLLALELTHAISRNAKVCTVEFEGSHHTIINLPTPQTSGTEVQNEAYNKQAADKLAEDYIRAIPQKQSEEPFTVPEGYESLSDNIETEDSDCVSVWENHGHDSQGQFYVNYLTHDYVSGVTRQYSCSVDPSKLSDEQRWAILDYVLGTGNYDKEEIVNYLDLFLHMQHLKPIHKGRW